MGSKGPDSLSPEQERGIVALLAEPTIQKAALAVGVSDTTMHRWLELPAFGRAYRNARREGFRHAIALTQKYAAHAVQTLMKVMSDPTAGHSAKVSAAGLLLKFSRESIELDDLAARVEALEQSSAPAGGIGPQRPFEQAA